MACGFTTLVLVIGILNYGKFTASAKTSQRMDQSLGTGFDISKVKIGTSVLTKGATIFEPIPLSCVLQQTLGKSEERFKYFEDSSQVVKSFKASGGLTPSFLSLVSLKTSLSATFSKLDQTDKKVNGASRVFYSHSHKDYLDKKCRPQLDEEFQRDFKALKGTVLNPQYTNSWTDYQYFVMKYGTHYVTEVTYGASVTQYMSADASLHYTSRNFTSKACLEVGAPVHAGIIKAGTCGSISNEDKKAASSLQMNYNLIVLGGSDATRNNVIRDPNSQNIVTLLNEGRTYESPILYRFAPIADLLMSLYINTDYNKQAANLKSYIDGFVNFGCKHKTDQYNLVDLQRFELDKDRSMTYPNYVCTVAPEGCRNDSDCHWWGSCKCHGNTCVRHEWQSPAWFGGGERKTIAKINNGTSPGMVNKYCKFSLLNHCRCQRKPYANERRIVWRSAEQGMKEQAKEMIASLMKILKFLV